MNRIGRQVCFVLVAVTVTSIAWVLGAYVGRRAAPRLELWVGSSRLDFGEVWEDTAFPWTLQVQNHSDKDIPIKGFSHSCSCAKIEPENLVIPAGASRELRLTIDLTEKADRTRSLARPFRLSLSPNLELVGTERYEWTIRGKVKTPVRFAQGWLDYGWHSEYDQPRFPQRVEVKAFVPLRRLDIYCASPAFKAQATRRPGAPLMFDVELTPVNTLPPGPINLEVVAVPELPEGKRLSAKHLRLVGHILSDLQASPPEAIFGARRVGETVEETVTLLSLSDSKFTVKEVRVIGGTGLAVRPLSQPPGGLTYQIHSRIAKEGDQTASIIFVVNLGTGEEREIRVEVSYRGLRAEATPDVE